MTPERLAEFRALLDAICDGSHPTWTVDVFKEPGWTRPEYDVECKHTHTDEKYGEITTFHSIATRLLDKSETEFVAAAPRMAAELITEVLRLQEELANLREDYEVSRDANGAVQQQRDWARKEVGRLRKAFVQIGWYCWECHKVNPVACKSGDVPVFARTEDAAAVDQDMAEHGGQP